MSLFHAEAAARFETAERFAPRLERGDVTVEMLDLDQAVLHSADWADLCNRALEPNIFMDPAFAIAAARHVSPHHRPSFLFAWEVGAERSARLIGLCLVQMPQGRFGPGCTFAWGHKQATLNAPLLDRDRAARALRGLLDWLGRSARSLGGLLVKGVPLDGAWRPFLDNCVEFRTAIVETRSRAILRPTLHENPHSGSARHAKDLRRLGRRLAERGTLAYVSARSPSEVRLAAERFLELEARGWKGGRRTALLLNPDLSTFMRAMTRSLAHAGQCHIDSLELDGRPIAMGIVLRSGDRAYYWKTAFDEAYASFSPGKQFSARLTQQLIGDAHIALVDSCAVPDHPMIDRLWPERMEVADILIGSMRRSPSPFRRAAGLLSMVARARRFAKRTVRGVRVASTGLRSPAV